MQSVIKPMIEELEKHVLDCPYNKLKNKEHECSDCDIPNDIIKSEIRATAKAFQVVLDGFTTVTCYEKTDYAEYRNSLRYWLTSEIDLAKKEVMP
jgi:predicted nucleic-acid-binding Zn-ribbon protein